MTYAREIRTLLELHEGKRYKVYTDSEGHQTIGIGHNLEKGLSDAVIKVIFEEDIEEAENELDRLYPDWRGLSKNRRLVLVDMMFNLGAPSFAKFYRFWKAVKTGEWETVAAEMIHSKWYWQVGARAERLAEMMKNG